MLKYTETSVRDGIWYVNWLQNGFDSNLVAVICVDVVARCYNDRRIKL